VDRVSTANPPPPDHADLRGLPRSLRELFEIGVRALAEDEGPSELALRSPAPRPQVTAPDVVLPDGVLESVEQHVIGVAEGSRDLLSAGQHLKRGLLLHGPPGRAGHTPCVT
jgi:hypothetical protein